MSLQLPPALQLVEVQTADIAECPDARGPISPFGSINPVARVTSLLREGQVDKRLVRLCRANGAYRRTLDLGV